MAQAKEVAIPRASQLNFASIKNGKYSIFAILLQLLKVQLSKQFYYAGLQGVALQKNYQMKKKWRWYVGFFAALFGLYFIFVFSFTDINQSNLPVINNNIQPFSFTDQNGKILTEKNVEGKVYVAEYFFTTCKGICPKMNTNMRRVYDEFKDNENFMILSHTCMPETDSVPLMKKYEEKMLGGILKKQNDGSYKMEEEKTAVIPVNRNWYFVTGDKAQLYNMARHSYIIDNNKTDTLTNISDQFIHTQFFALVDKQTRLRGIYDGLKEEEIQKLIKDTKALLKETYQYRSLK
jgi:protein SCO1